MPGKNIIKTYGSEQYYHVYSRGVAKQPVFLDTDDYVFFLSLFKRYLSSGPAVSKARVPYPWFGDRLELLAYCLMPNHVHLLVYQHDQEAMLKLMQSIMTSYSVYFNKKYKRVGPVFQSRYRASLVDRDNYLHHISRYIHLNPKDWRKYDYSSLPYYLSEKNAEWLHSKKILELFDNNTAKYLEFLKDNEDQAQMIDELKWELAHE
jgi:putative transposase